MQSLNVQILTPKNEGPKVQGVKTEKNSSDSTFKNLVESMSKKDTARLTKASSSKKEISTKTENPAENDQISENSKSVEKGQEKSSARERISKKSEKNVKTENKVEVEEKTETQVEETVAEEKVSPEVKSQYEKIASLMNSDSNSQRMELSSDNAESAEIKVDVSAEEVSFLKSSAVKTDDTDFIIENVEEYNSDELKSSAVKNAQILSVEDPDRFLKQAEMAGENELASAVAQENLDLTFSRTDRNEEKNDYFDIEIVNKDGTKTQSKSLFENLFTVTDNRSVEQKIADFKNAAVETNTESSENNLELTMSLNANAMQNIKAENNQSAGAAGSTFQQMLSQQIQTSAPDFVKAGSIVLRDNNQGSINMILKPESLGNVKVALQISDNVVTGNITVHSKEAFEAFKQNMDNLRQAFQDSGFENAQLNLNLADGSTGNAFAQNEHQTGSEKFFSNKVYGNYAVSASETDSDEVNIASVFESAADKKVSIVA